jgi:hypothetical protein
VCPEEAGRNLRFDDRLLTVLNQPAGDRHDVAVRWRQLVDLVARAGSNSAARWSPRPWRRSATKPPMSTSNSARPRHAPSPPCRSRSHCSNISHPTASRSQHQCWRRQPWTLRNGKSLIASADEETRRFVETLHPEIAAGPGTDLTEALIETPAEKEAASPAQRPPAGPSLSEVVARIERRRRIGRFSRRRVGQDPARLPDRRRCSAGNAARRHRLGRRGAARPADRPFDRPQAGAKWRCRGHRGRAGVRGQGAVP